MQAFVENSFEVLFQMFLQNLSNYIVNKINGINNRSLFILDRFTQRNGCNYGYSSRYCHNTSYSYVKAKKS
jgi:hypothetical protein